MRILTLALLSALASQAVKKLIVLPMPKFPKFKWAELSEQTMKDVTQKLSSDEFEGRAPGSPGEEKTAAYLVERFKAAGLEPGNGDSWSQDVPLVEITAKNVSPLTITAKDGTPVDVCQLWH